MTWAFVYILAGAPIQMKEFRFPCDVLLSLVITLSAVVDGIGRY